MEEGALRRREKKHSRMTKILDDFMNFYRQLKHIVSTPVIHKDHSSREQLPIFKSCVMPVELHCPFLPRPREFIVTHYFCQEPALSLVTSKELSKSIFLSLGFVFGRIFVSCSLLEAAGLTRYSLKFGFFRGNQTPVEGSSAGQYWQTCEWGGRIECSLVHLLITIHLYH